MNKDKTWCIKDKKSVFKIKLFDVIRLDCYLPSKDIHNDFYSISMHNWVNIFSLTNDNKIIFVKQHRIGKNIVTMEVPAGAIDEGEKPLDAAKRELVEETGYTSDKFILLKEISVNPAIQNNTCYFFLALNCIKSHDTKFDSTEELELMLKEKDEIDNIINSNLIDNSLAYLAVILARDYLKNM